MKRTTPLSATAPLPIVALHPPPNGSGTKKQKPVVNAHMLQLRFSLVLPQPLNIHGKFSDRLLSILAGEVTVKPEQMFEPLEPFDTELDICVGKISDDPISQELYSFEWELREQANQLPSPRKLSDVREIEYAAAILENQACAVEWLFLSRIMTIFPQTAIPGALVSVKEGWIISLPNPANEHVPVPGDPEVLVKRRLLPAFVAAKNGVH